jgi:type IV secretory pathway VirB10-like protein
MTSAIKTIIKNKSSNCFRYSAYPRYQIALRPCGEVGDCTEIAGDIFSFMETRQEALSLVKLMLNGTVDISYAVDGLFTADKAEANSLVKHPDVGILAQTLDKSEEAPIKPNKPAATQKQPEPKQEVGQEDKPAEEPKQEEPKQEAEPTSNTEEQKPADSFEEQSNSAAPTESTENSENTKQEGAQPVTNRRRNKNIKLG